MKRAPVIAAEENLQPKTPGEILVFGHFWAKYGQNRVKMGSNGVKSGQMGSDQTKWGQMGSNWAKWGQIGSNSGQMGSNWAK